MVKWGKLFKKGASSQTPAPAPSPSVPAVAVQAAKGRLDEAEELLTKKRDLLERQAAEQLQAARQHNAQGNKAAALQALKRKKLLEAQLEQIDNSILRIAEQQLMLETSATTILTVATLGEASKAAAVVTGELSVGAVDRLRDELEEQHADMAAITDMLGHPMGAAAEYDEEELEAEFEELEHAEVEEELLGVAPVPTRVPVGLAAPAVKSAEELELEQLEAELLAA